MTQNTKLLAIAGMLGTVLLGLALLTGGAAAADDIDRSNLTNDTATVNYSVGDTLEVSALFADAPANATISIQPNEAVEVNATNGNTAILAEGMELWAVSADKKTINVTQSDLYADEIWVTRTFETRNMFPAPPESFNKSEVELAVTFTDNGGTDDTKIDNSITEVHEPGGGGGILAGTSSGQTLLLGLAALGGLFWAVRSDTL